MNGGARRKRTKPKRLKRSWGYSQIDRVAPVKTSSLAAAPAWIHHIGRTSQAARRRARRAAAEAR